MTSRGDVHYVVTEYGVASLHGKSIRERALALIHIAHPNFREQLAREARARHWIQADQIVALEIGEPDLSELAGPMTLADGRQLLLRPVQPTDEDMLRDLFYSYSPETVLHRFFHVVKSMPHADLQKLLQVDYRRDMILVAVHGQDPIEKIVAIGRYHVEPATGAAEVAFSMRDDWQHLGIGATLFRRLIEIARARGVVTFRAEVMADNPAMVRLFHKCAEGPVTSRLVGSIYDLSFTLGPSAPGA